MHYSSEWQKEIGKEIVWERILTGRESNIINRLDSVWLCDVFSLVGGLMVDIKHGYTPLRVLG